MNIKPSNFELVLGIANYKPNIGVNICEYPPCLATQEAEVGVLPLCLTLTNKPSPVFNDHMWTIGSRYNLDDSRTAFGTRHLIPYCLILTSDNKLVVYRRKGNEDRLNSKWSAGVGGHIGLESVKTQIKPNGYTTVAIRQTVFNALCKELYEEVEVRSDQGIWTPLPTSGDSFFRYNDLYLLGEINLADTEVDRLHTGVAFLLHTRWSSKNIRITDGAEETAFLNVIDDDGILIEQSVGLEPWSDRLLAQSGVSSYLKHCLNKRLV